MMKKISIFICLILLLSEFGFGQGFQIGTSAGYFSMKDSRHKEVYNSGGIIYGINLSYGVFEWMEIRGEFGLFHQKGYLTFTQEETKLNLIPGVLGVRAFLLKKKIKPYLGLGGHMFYYREVLPDRMGDATGSAVGAHIEGGAYYNFTSGLYADLTVRYIIGTRVNVDIVGYDDYGKPEKVSLDGFQVRLGFGFKF